MPLMINRVVRFAVMTAVLGCAWPQAARADLDDHSRRGTGLLSSGLSMFHSITAPGLHDFEKAMAIDIGTGKTGDVALRNADGLQSLYQENGLDPLWVEVRGSNHKKAEEAFAILSAAWQEGLNPEQYHTAEIAKLIKADTPEDRAALELLVSDAVASYAHDMTGLRLPAKAVDVDPQYWRVPIKPADFLIGLQSGDPVKAVQSLEPDDELYQRLKKELASLVSSPDRVADKEPPIRFAAGVLRPGDVDRGVPRLRAHFGLPQPAKQARMVYDPKLAKAVMEFQRQNGLTADGHIGPKTLALMNRSIDDRIDQIVANMERLRWDNRDKPDKYLLVNIPAQTLWGVENDDVKFEMPVIVGRPERPTKSFITTVIGVRFNPTWTVPPTIKESDFLPKLRADPHYLDGRGIEVSAMMDGKREVIDPSTIDWQSMTPEGLRGLRMVQEPGEDNALGSIRILMPNQYDIYLHDTDSPPEWFGKESRALSSGCIRLSDPPTVARFVLEDNKNWSDARMQRLIDSKHLSEVSAAKQFPVYILYQTMWLDSDDRLVYGPDVYGLDKQLIDNMAALKAFALPNTAPAK